MMGQFEVHFQIASLGIYQLSGFGGLYHRPNKRPMRNRKPAQIIRHQTNYFGTRSAGFHLVWHATRS